MNNFFNFQNNSRNTPKNGFQVPFFLNQKFMNTPKNKSSNLSLSNQELSTTTHRFLSGNSNLSIKISNRNLIKRQNSAKKI